MTRYFSVQSLGLMIVALVAWGSLFLATSSTSPAEAQVVECEDLALPGLFTDTTVTTAQLVVSAGVENCRVAAVINPTPDSNIGVEYRLPTDWTEK